MPAKRVKRPKLERDRPRREWSTLFGASAPKKEAPSPATPRAGAGVLSDTVELGYRVIEDYLKQGQQVAQAFGVPGGMGGVSAGSPSGSPEEMQQMAQRVMQYGWDFAGMWFEMWSRMGGSNAWPGMPGAPGPRGEAGSNGGAVDAKKGPSGGSPSGPRDGSPSGLAVSVESAQPTTTSVELRPGHAGELAIHALRPEGHDGVPIKNVKITRQAEDGGLLIEVVIASKQRPGNYRAPIVDAKSNLPCGALLVRVGAKKR